MKIKKIPLRTCVVTGEKCPKKDLLRIVKSPNNEILVDLNGKMNGRGAYIKKDLEVLEKEIKTKRLAKHLECDIPNSIYDEIRNIINN